MAQSKPYRTLPFRCAIANESSLCRGSHLLGHAQAQVEVDDHRVRPSGDVHDTKLLEASRRAAGGDHVLFHELGQIDIRGVRHELRVDLESQIEGISRRFIVYAIDTYVVQDNHTYVY